MANKRLPKDIGLVDPLRDSISRATALADSMRLADPLRDSISRATTLAGSMRLADPLRDSISRVNALADSMRLADPLRESINRVTALADSMRLADPLRDSISRATALAGSMRFADPLRDSISRATALAGSMRLGDPLRDSISRATTLQADLRHLPVHDRFQSIGMATAATAIGISSPAAFASVWQSPQISAFAGRFVGDPTFKHEFLERIKNWQFEDLVDDPPDGDDILSAIEETIENADIADQVLAPEAVAAKLTESWANLPPALRQMVGAFIIGLILLIIEYCFFLPTLHPQEPATQQRIREQRKLAACAISELGVNSIAFRVAAVENLPVYADHRRDAPRTGNLELGQTVEIVRKNRNWCEVIWLAPNGDTMGGWVQTRYLRRL